MADLTLKIITVSTRPGRKGKAVADWFTDFAKQDGSFAKVEQIDLAEVNLPIFDEPNHPNTQEYIHEHTKQWSKTIAEADAFVIVTPEYNFFAPPSIINALDYLHHEWKYKVAAIIGYGGVSAGTRSAQSLKPLLANLGMMPIANSVYIPFFAQHIEDGVFTPTENHLAAAEALLPEVHKWATALKPLHS